MLKGVFAIDVKGWGKSNLLGKRFDQVCFIFSILDSAATYTRALNYDSITSNHAPLCQVVVTGNNTVLQNFIPYFSSL